MITALTRVRHSMPADLPLLETIATLVPDGAMRKMFWATETEMMAWEHAGIMVPRTVLSAARLRWSPKDAEASLDE